MGPWLLYATLLNGATVALYNVGRSYYCSSYVSHHEVSHHMTISNDSNTGVCRREGHKEPALASLLSSYPPQHLSTVVCIAACNMLPATAGHRPALVFPQAIACDVHTSAAGVAAGPGLWRVCGCSRGERDGPGAFHRSRVAAQRLHGGAPHILCTYGCLMQFMMFLSHVRYVTVRDCYIWSWPLANHNVGLDLLAVAHAPLRVHAYDHVFGCLRSSTQHLLLVKTLLVQEVLSAYVHSLHKRHWLQSVETLVEPSWRGVSLLCCQRQLPAPSTS